MALTEEQLERDILAALERRRQKRERPGPVLLSPDQPGVKAALNRRRQAIGAGEIPNPSNPPSL